MTVQLPCDDVGAGAPVLLLHAGVADRRMWREHLQPLADAGLRAVAMDLPGFGEAPVPAGEDAPWLDVLATADALGLRRFALVGSSFGGMVALRVAVTAPERVGALALFSALAPGIEPSSELEAVWASEEAALQRGDIDAAVEAVLDAWTLPDAPAELRERVGTMQRRALELQAAGTPVPEGPDPLGESADGLEGVPAPALVAVGELDRSEFHHSADALALALPAGRKVVIAGAGHLAPLERPDAVRELLAGLLVQPR